MREGDIATLTKQQGFFLIGLAAGDVFPRDEAIWAGLRRAGGGRLLEVALTTGRPSTRWWRCWRRGLRLRHLVEKRQTLEDLFMATVRSAEPGVDERPERRGDGARPSRREGAGPMKFLALMKDSFREAVDTWVVYATLVRSALLILVVASVSYRPVTVQEEAQQNPGSVQSCSGSACAKTGASARSPISSKPTTHQRPSRGKGIIAFPSSSTCRPQEEAKKLAKQLPIGKMQESMEKVLDWARDLDVNMDTALRPHGSPLRRGYARRPR